MNNRPPCPRCHERQIYKHGSKVLSDGLTIRRWFCPRCRKTFQQYPLIEQLTRKIED